MKNIAIIFSTLALFSCASPKLEIEYVSPAVSSHSVIVKPSNPVKAGSRISILTHYAVEDGGKADIDEEFSLIDPKTGKPVVVSRKNAGKKSGRFSNRFDLQLPKKVPLGNYPAASKVFVNNKHVSTKQFILSIR